MEQTKMNGWVDDGLGDFLADTQDDWKARYRDDNGGGNASSLSFTGPVVGGVVRHILMVGVLHDYADVLVAEKVEDVLKLYGLSLKSCNQELKELRGALLCLGSKNQTRELSRFLVENCGHSTEFVKPLGRQDEKSFLEHEKLFRKVYLGGLRKRRACSDERSEKACQRPDERLVSLSHVCAPGEIEGARAVALAV